jgi:hypothetical protein
METTYSSVPNNIIKVVMGDLNGKERLESIHKGDIGKYSLRFGTDNKIEL